ncbi:hypothetical protein [Streptomyces sp. NPDC017095]|uniref:hypothetical protein n=1 Tax=Streptomyces sp. NPDC017095 TaxID=3364977 RepID=UPI0037897A75
MRQVRVVCGCDPTGAPGRDAVKRWESGKVIERDALRIVHVMHYRNPEGEPFSVHGWYRYAPHTIRPAV